MAEATWAGRQAWLWQTYLPPVYFRLSCTAPEQLGMAHLFLGCMRQAVASKGSGSIRQAWHGISSSLLLLSSPSPFCLSFSLCLPPTWHFLRVRTFSLSPHPSYLDTSSQHSVPGLSDIQYQWCEKHEHFWHFYVGEQTFGV